MFHFIASLPEFLSKNGPRYIYETFSLYISHPSTCLVLLSLVGEVDAGNTSINKRKRQKNKKRKSLQANAAAEVSMSKQIV